LTLETAVPTVTITTAGGDTNVASHTITGSVSGDATAPGSTVSLFDNGSTTALGTALVQADGSWTEHRHAGGRRQQHRGQGHRPRRQHSAAARRWC
jgi:hypothetical protein